MTDTKDATNRGLITYRYSTLFADAYFEWLMVFIGTSLWSTHNENIAHNTYKCQAVRGNYALYNE